MARSAYLRPAPILVLSALLTLAACRFGGRPSSVSFDGREYPGMGSDYYVITGDDVLPIGIATNVDPPSAVSDVTVFQVDGIPPDQLIAMRAAPARPYEFELFLNRAAGFPAELCAFVNPANPPSEEDCP